MSYSVGLTGGIGMGKSTTAGFFADLGAKIWDADEAVARLYAPGAAGALAISEQFPGAVTDHGVDRAALRQAIQDDPGALTRLEALIHPLLVADRAGFRAQYPSDVLIFDIPLLFEAGLAGEMDSTIAVTTDDETQARRVLARPGMTETLLHKLRARQLSDSARRAQADHVIETTDLDSARAAATSLMRVFQQGSKERPC